MPTLRKTPRGVWPRSSCQPCPGAPHLEVGHTAQRSTTIYNFTIMAKGIDINGQLRGKRGGVVYYRANGQQISRARNFNPKNPKTNAQLIQRAVTATVMMMYSAGKEIFDHSFEGKSVPGGSQRAFMSENMRMLRKGITADLEAIENGTYDDEEALAAASPYRVVSPRSYGPTATPYIISKGTFKNSPFTVQNTSTGAFQLIFGPNVVEGETVEQYLAKRNLQEGDIITLCVLSGSMADSSRVSSPELQFTTLRFITKAAVEGSVVNKTLGDLFEIKGKGALAASYTFTFKEFAIETGSQIYNTAENEWAAGFIMSRDDSGLRSNSVMTVKYGSKVDPFISVTAASLVDSWKRAVESTDSSLILEGGKF